MLVLKPLWTRTLHIIAESTFQALENVTAPDRSVRALVQVSDSTLAR